MAFFQALAVSIVIINPFWPLSLAVYGNKDIMFFAELAAIPRYLGLGALVFLLAMIAGKGLKFPRLGRGRIIGICAVAAAAIVYEIVGLVGNLALVKVFTVLSGPVALVLSAAYALLRTAGFKPAAFAAGDAPAMPAGDAPDGSAAVSKGDSDIINREEF